jgi:hypothetical protein
MICSKSVHSSNVLKMRVGCLRYVSKYLSVALYAHVSFACVCERLVETKAYSDFIKFDMHTSCSK